MAQPLLSIVMANYNYGRFIEDAIQSVLAQNMGSKLELIICDAASTDNSIEIIKKYAGQISWWCSEPDDGQSAAFNKGFAQARGKFLTWLNADDVLLPGTIMALDAMASANPRCEWFVGGSLWLDPDLKVVKCNPARKFSWLRYRCGIVSTWAPSSFFSRRLFSEVGGVDERFHYMMDSDLWLRAAKLGYRYLPFKKYAFGLRLHPDAKMSGHNFSCSDMANPNHPKWTQIRNERKWMREGFNWWKMGMFKRILSASYVKYGIGVLDTFRFRGVEYRKAISGGMK